MIIILIYFLTINLTGFFVIWHDKNQAIRHRYRVPEKTLLAIVVIGGVVGSGLAMLIFRHKTTKTSYLFRFFGIIVLQLISVIWFFINY